MFHTRVADRIIKPPKKIWERIGAVCEQWCLSLTPAMEVYCKPPTGSFGLLSLYACKDKIKLSNTTYNTAYSSQNGGVVGDICPI